MRASILREGGQTHLQLLEMMTSEENVQPTTSSRSFHLPREINDAIIPNAENAKGQGKVTRVFYNNTPLSVFI
jgi:hypothetical protein